MNFMNAILRMEERKYEISFNLTFGLLNAFFPYFYGIEIVPSERQHNMRRQRVFTHS